MLEGEHNNISDALERRRSVRSREALCDNNSDTAMDVSSVPMGLLEEFLVKWREAQAILIAILIHFYVHIHPC
jgi:hypothetical protein